VRRALDAVVFCIALLLMPATAQAGWTTARDLPTGDTFAPAAATAGRGTEVLGFLGRGGGVLARFPGGRVASPTRVQGEGYAESAGFHVAASPSGRVAAVWLWSDGTDDGAETRIECCQRAVVATWEPRGKPRRRVLSEPGLDVRDVTVKMLRDGRALVAWQEVGSGAIQVARERGDGRFAVHRVDDPAPFKSHYQDVTLALDRNDRATVNWLEGGLGDPPRFMAARSDGRGRFAAARQVGGAPEVGINPYDVVADGNGAQVLVWTANPFHSDGALLMATRTADGSFGPARTLATGDDLVFDAAAGPRGDAIVVWQQGAHVGAVRRAPGGEFGEEQALPASVSSPVAGIDASGRITMLYSASRRVYARAASRGGPFGPARPVSRWIDNRDSCGGARIDVAPNGDAVALWGCSVRGFDEQLQGAVYHR
jgi:hypothetical protein